MALLHLAKAPSKCRGAKVATHDNLEVQLKRTADQHVGQHPSTGIRKATAKAGMTTPKSLRGYAPVNMYASPHSLHFLANGKFRHVNFGQRQFSGLSRAVTCRYDGERAVLTGWLTMDELVVKGGGEYGDQTGKAC